MTAEKYIMLVDERINELIEEEVQYGLTWENEQELHLLLENCKHIKEYIKDYNPRR